MACPVNAAAPSRRISRRLDIIRDFCNSRMTLGAAGGRTAWNVCHIHCVFWDIRHIDTPCWHLRTRIGPHPDARETRVAEAASGARGDPLNRRRWLRP